MYSQEEKTLLLGSLFHDIGKFEQRCTGNTKKQQHQYLGTELISSGRFIDLFANIVGTANIEPLKNIISEHHNQQAKSLTRFVREADRLSASEREDFDSSEEPGERWTHKHLCSLFSKIGLLSQVPVEPRYYKQSLITKSYDIIIPTIESESKSKDYVFAESAFTDFINDLEAVLKIYREDSDFDTVINLLLILFEKYLWCIPDFTGNEFTDISLYNHLKDTAAFSHAIYLTRKAGENSTNLNLLIGDLPGIQSYIFNSVYKKPAKILRGRSIFVQVLTRNFATKFLTKLGLSEANLIMHAGGKFYILAPATEEFKERYNSVVKEIEDYLFTNFEMDLSFNSAYHTFDYEQLKKRKITFGQIVEEASGKLIQNKHKLFVNKLFNPEDLSKDSFVWSNEYISAAEGSDSIKCKVTDKPIKKGRNKPLRIGEGENSEDIIVDKQVKTEYTIGDEIPDDNVVILMKENGLDIDLKRQVKDYNPSQNNNYNKIILNPDFDELRKDGNLKKEVYRDARFLDVANYCSKDAKNNVMAFEDITECGTGADFLTLIKGDIDNLGMIMAFGLQNDSKDNRDLSAVSRTTTLSNHLKYYFSFFLNGLLKDWETKKPDNKVYTIFAGGDDLMLVCPQSSAAQLLEEFNKKFSEFTCGNHEVHISYSVTHFKDHTPIRMVAEFAEHNQKKGKKIDRVSQRELLNQKSGMTFFAENDKAGTYIFDSFIKNEKLPKFNSLAAELAGWTKDDVGLTQGMLRKLLGVAEANKLYKEKKDPAHLIWRARLTYSINRLLKDRNGIYKNKAMEHFCESVLKIGMDSNSKEIQEMLYPLICQVIYKIRK